MTSAPSAFCTWNFSHVGVKSCGRHLKTREFLVGCYKLAKKDSTWRIDRDCAVAGTGESRPGKTKLKVLRF